MWVSCSLRVHLTAECSDELHVQRMGCLIRYNMASRQAPVASTGQQGNISLHSMQASQLLPVENVHVLKGFQSLERTRMSSSL